MNNRVVIVSGLIIHEGRILLAKRRKDSLRGDMWEVPGGKVEPGETERDALVRELKEELGIVARVDHLVSVGRFEWPDPVLLLLYRCEILEGWPKPLASQELRYVPPATALASWAMLPSGYLWYPDILAELEQ